MWPLDSLWTPDKRLTNRRPDECLKNVWQTPDEYLSNAWFDNSYNCFIILHSINMTIQSLKSWLLIMTASMTATTKITGLLMSVRLPQSIFNVKNQLNFFKKNINLGDHFLAKHCFSKLNFWTTLLSKIMSNFWWTDISRRIFYIFSLGVCWFLAKNLTVKPCLKFHNRTDIKAYVAFTPQHKLEIHFDEST